MIHYSSTAHLFSSRIYESPSFAPTTLASSSGVKSDSMLNAERISSGVLPFIILATFAQLRLTPTHNAKRHVQKGLDEEEVRGDDQVHELLRRNRDEVRIPLGHDVPHVAALQRPLDLRQRLIQVVRAFTVTLLLLPYRTR